MKIAKLLKIGQNQVLEIPEEYSLAEEEVIVNKIGDILLISSKSRAKDMFLAGAVSFTDDFMADGGSQPAQQEHEISE
jgi:virulence-associated protein VagC